MGLAVWCRSVWTCRLGTPGTGRARGQSWGPRAVAVRERPRAVAGRECPCAPLPAPAVSFCFSVASPGCSTLVVSFFCFLLCLFCLSESWYLGNVCYTPSFSSPVQVGTKLNGDNTVSWSVDHFCLNVSFILQACTASFFCLPFGVSPVKPLLNELMAAFQHLS